MVQQQDMEAIEQRWEFVQKELAVRMHVSPWVLRYYVENSGSIVGLTITQIMTALTREYESFRVPTDWWQMFKQRWYPVWLLRWFPVQSRIYRFARYCPHLNVSDNGVHAKWLADTTFDVTTPV